MKNYKNILTKMKKFKLYIVKFEKNSVIKNKIYLSDFAIYNNDCYLIIIITHNKYTFSANNRIQKALT